MNFLKVFEMYTKYLKKHIVLITCALYILYILLIPTSITGLRHKSSDVYGNHRLSKYKLSLYHRHTKLMRYLRWQIIKSESLAVSLSNVTSPWIFSLPTNGWVGWRLVYKRGDKTKTVLIIARHPHNTRWKTSWFVRTGSFVGGRF